MRPYLPWVGVELLYRLHSLSQTEYVLPSGGVQPPVHLLASPCSQTLWLWTSVWQVPSLLVEVLVLVELLLLTC